MSLAYAGSAWPSRDADGRTNQKVRRESREALVNEPVEFLSPRQRRERIAAFRRHATEIRTPGRRRGSAGTYSTIAGDVLDYLMMFAVQTGRIFPSYEEIAKACGCAYRTAVRVILQLKRGGWLYWERRFVRVGKPGTAEPQVEQTSNFYRLAVPNVASALMKAWRDRRPPPPDDVDAQAAAAAQDPDVEAREMALKKLHAIRSLMSASMSPKDREAIAKRTAELEAALSAYGAGVTSRSEASSTAVDERPKREFP